ncbi:unnamed protein product [Urochloa humidicola]
MAAAAAQVMVDGGEPPRMICRICDFEIPMACAKGHFTVCTRTLADRCDAKGHNADQCLLRVADVLHRILAGFFAGSASSTSPSSSSSGAALSHLLSVPSTELFPTSPPVATPRTSEAESQLARHFVDVHAGGGGGGEDFQQIESLLAIARSVERIKISEYKSLEDLSSFLRTSTPSSTPARLTPSSSRPSAAASPSSCISMDECYREKFMHLCAQIDDINATTGGAGELLHPIDEEAPAPSPAVSMRALDGNAAVAGGVAGRRLKDRMSIEDFEIIKPISRGAFGRVFLARKRVTGDLFAIKVLKKADMIRKNAVESILAERDILISARTHSSSGFRNLGCLDEDMVRTYIAELVLALEYLHSMNVIHRDLKPDNLLIGRDGHIKLTDFGLSKVGLINSTDNLSRPDVSSVLVGDHQPADAEQRAQQRQQRQKQTTVGTPDYLAPEILLGMTHGHTADWWSVGIILFELLVGIPPFNAEHPQKYSTT